MPSFIKNSKEKTFALSACLCQLILLIIVASHFDYKDASDPPVASGTTNRVAEVYPYFQDVHVMIFVGFGFLMTYLSKYGFSAVGLNFLISTLCIQWGIVCVSLIHQIFSNHYHTVILQVTHLVLGDFAAAAVMISFGAVLGRVTPTQLIWMAVLEILFYAINEYIGAIKLEAIDMGGSMYVHVFGAYFGLGVSYMMGAPSKEETKRNKSHYSSDLFAMVGTLFLWMFWPSFNGALTSTDHFAKERCVINTVLSLCGSCMAAYVTSILFTHQRKFDMVHIQNATLAGGVAVGTCSNMVIGPYAAILIGYAAGTLSVWGYIYLSPLLEKAFNLADTCGVHNLHGMPGVMAGVAGAIAAASAGNGKYGDNLTAIFPGRSHRSAMEQGGYQLAVLVITLVIAFSSGLFTGFLLRSPAIFVQQKSKFDDREWFEVPDDFELADLIHTEEDDSQSIQLEYCNAVTPTSKVQDSL